QSRIAGTGPQLGKSSQGEVPPSCGRLLPGAVGFEQTDCRSVSARSDRSCVHYKPAEPAKGLRRLLPHSSWHATNVRSVCGLAGALFIANGILAVSDRYVPCLSWRARFSHKKRDRFVSLVEHVACCVALGCAAGRFFCDGRDVPGSKRRTHRLDSRELYFF